MINFVNMTDNIEILKGFGIIGIRERCFCGQIVKYYCLDMPKYCLN